MYKNEKRTKILTLTNDLNTYFLTFWRPNSTKSSFVFERNGNQSVYLTPHFLEPKYSLTRPSPDRTIKWFWVRDQPGRETRTRKLTFGYQRKRSRTFTKPSREPRGESSKTRLEKSKGAGDKVSEDLQDYPLHWYTLRPGRERQKGGWKGGWGQSIHDNLIPYHTKRKILGSELGREIRVLASGYPIV